LTCGCCNGAADGAAVRFPAWWWSNLKVFAAASQWLWFPLLLWSFWFARRSVMAATGYAGCASLQVRRREDGGAVERAWFRWCAMAAEAAAIVVREEEELAGGSRWLQVYAARRDGRKRWRVVVREPAAVMASLRRRWCYFADGLSARTSFTELWRSAVMREMARCCCGGAVAAGASPAMV